ncbi:hypothetical protein GW764_02365 [Candidatus Parcubacteria bacterium]|nr:hypothetical protein [Candidatus Parcubacteria bacterium]
MILNFIELFIILAGFVIGLGAVVVIDLHGFLARKSNYWTLATTRTHKVTKPMIWVGMTLVLIGGLLNYSGNFLLVHLILSGLLILNGLFLNFVVSPFLLKREREGMESELLPDSLQKKIIISFILSVIGWWTSIGLFILFLL